MPQPLAGAGQGLQYPEALYPAYLTNGSFGGATNIVVLAPGEALPIRAGRFMVDAGKYGSIQYLDPVTNVWTLLRSGANGSQTMNVWSDGFNARVANLTGCAIAAVVTNGGNGAYVQSTTTVTPSAGNSTWQPIIGGAVNTTVSITSVSGVGQGGSGYGIAPLVFFDAPPVPGVQATGIAVLSSGSVSSITVIDQGAGYTAAPGIAIYPNPADPNINASIVNALAVCSLTGAGSLTAVVCTNSGAAVASTMSLTVVGAGASATATPLFMQTATSVTVANAGAGYGTFTALTTSGGYNTTANPSFTNPTIQLYDYIPRQAQIALAMSGTGITSVTSITDGGLFLSTPVAVPLTNGIISTVSTLTVVLGSANTTVKMQQLA